MFGFRKFVRKEFKKIARAFRKRDKIIQENKIDIGDIKEEIKSLHKQLREATTPITTRSSLGSMQKRVLKRLDSIKLMKAIKGYISDGYTTNQVKDEIINRFGIGTTCFYKYLKMVRQSLRVVTTRSTTRSNKNK